MGKQYFFPRAFIDQQAFEGFLQSGPTPPSFYQNKLMLAKESIHKKDRENAFSHETFLSTHSYEKG